MHMHASMCSLLFGDPGGQAGLPSDSDFKRHLVYGPNTQVEAAWNRGQGHSQTKCHIVTMQTA